MKTRSQTRLLAQAQQHQIQSSDLTNPTHPVPKAADDCCGVEDNNDNVLVVYDSLSKLRQRKQLHGRRQLATLVQVPGISILQDAVHLPCMQSGSPKQPNSPKSAENERHGGPKPAHMHALS